DRIDPVGLDQGRHLSREQGAIRLQGFDKTWLVRWLRGGSLGLLFLRGAVDLLLITLGALGWLRLHLGRWLRSVIFLPLLLVLSQGRLVTHPALGVGPGDLQRGAERSRLGR